MTDNYRGHVNTRSHSFKIRSPPHRTNTRQEYHWMRSEIPRTRIIS